MPAVGAGHRIDVEGVGRQDMVGQNWIFTASARPTSVRQSEQPDVWARRGGEIAGRTPHDGIGSIRLRREACAPQRQLDGICRCGTGCGLPNPERASVKKHRRGLVRRVRSLREHLEKARRGLDGNPSWRLAIRRFERAPPIRYARQ